MSFPDLFYDIDTIIPPVNPRRGLDDGLDVLRDAGRSARLWEAWRERRLDDGQVRRLLDRVVGSASTTFRTVTSSLANGTEKLKGWFRTMRQGVTAHVFAGSLAVFGPDPRPVDLRETEAAVVKQLEYLWGFRDAIREGRQLLTGAEARAELYARAVWGEAQNLARKKAHRDGFTQERRVLGVADHCQNSGVPGCLEQAALRWQPIGVLVPISATTCRSRCHCHFEFR